MTDTEIIAGFLSPDTRAQDKAIAFFSNRIKGPIIDHVRANSGTRLEAVDLVQEVIVALYQLIKKSGFTLNPGTKLSTLAWSIGRNLWLKVLRERRKTAGDNIEEGMRNEPAETRTALDLMADTERLDAAWRAFEMLDEKCRTLLRMEMAEHSTLEIATALAYDDQGSVRVKKFKCMNRWKELYRATMNDTPNGHE
ncbi:MAG: sigma-70 family RNA polymerase sigma factor [Flavobacteriales bacterium]|nr:MAG: sigma-70 family RNA polymerase sigma factor [Flavobacteriales bacterium]